MAGWLRLQVRAPMSNFILLVSLLLAVVVGAARLVLLIPLGIDWCNGLPPSASTPTAPTTASLTSASSSARSLASTGTASSSGTAIASAAASTAFATTILTPASGAGFLPAQLFILASLKVLFLTLLSLVAGVAIGTLYAACILHVQNVAVNICLQILELRRRQSLQEPSTPHAREL